MQWAFFRITVTGGDEGDNLNRFLRSVRVLNLHREFVAQGDASYWAVVCSGGVASTFFIKWKM